MKKKLVISLTLVLALLLACSIAVFSIYTPKALLARMYTGDRVVINLYANVDENTASISFDNSNDLTEEEAFENANDICTIKNIKDYSKIGVHTNEYGNGKIHILLNEKYPICLEYYQFNWWDIQRINVYIDIDSTKNLITYHYDYSCLDENGEKLTYKTETQQDNLNSSNYIWIGRD